MPKALKTTTIIPEHLYVERDADRQLNRIIEDMGRPGYVLVARQMGKTNLLLHMKRRRERLGDNVLYFDLSSRFDSARTFFRHVIDTVVSSKADLFADAARQIVKERNENGFEANVEYDRHLRLLLRAAKTGKLILVFDEIDSLVSSPYSDQIFAQIRSMYFSRVNHGEYENLTYVLSGVAEPTDLIKDRNISPFNIGQKIYLTDFTKSEFETLLNKAELRFDPSVREKVFEWTQGNPRMTWDICSALEEIDLPSKKVVRDNVDDVVQQLYLNRFDFPPVDHIRSLVETDVGLHTAITSIRWGKGETLDEKTKSRLYLAGVIGGFGDSPTLKNPIIDRALSDEWLTQVAIAKRGLLQTASDYYVANRYQDARREYERFLETPNAELDAIHRTQYGASLYYVGELQDSIKQLQSVIAERPEGDLAATAEFYMASAMLRAGALQDAVRHLQAVANKPSGVRLLAKTTLSSAYLTDAKKVGDTIALCSEIIEEVQNSTKPDKDVLAVAYFNIGQANLMLAKTDLARQAFKDARVETKTRFHPTILAKEIIVSPPKDREGLAIAAATLIVQQKLSLSSAPVTTLELSEKVLAEILNEVREATAFDELLDYAAQKLYSPPKSKFRTIADLVDDTDHVELLWLALERFVSEATPDELFGVYRDLAILSSGSKKSEAMALYLSALEGRENIGVTDEEIALVLNHIRMLVGDGKFRQASKVVEQGKLLLSRVDTTWREFFRLALLNQEFEILRSLNDIPNGRKAAERLLTLLDSKKISEDVEMRETVRFMRRQAAAFIKLHVPDPYRHLGRNDKILVKNISTGDVQTVKFKQVERDLRSGRFVIVEEQPKSPPE